MSTSYSNLGGTGVRTWITATATLAVSGSPSVLVNGIVDNNFFFSGSSAAGFTLRFDFGPGQSVVIDEAKWYQSNSTNEAVWQWQGSNDGTTWTNIGSSFTLGGATPFQTITALSGNTTGYRYYQLLGVSGTTSSSPWLQEIEFKISGASSPYAGPSITAPIGGGVANANHQKVAPPASITFLPSHFTPVPVGAHLAGGVIGTAYSETITAQGGTSPYTFSVVSGSLPPGLGLATFTGVISGTPTTAGTYNFTIEVFDSVGFAGTQGFQIIVAAPSAGGGGGAYTFIA